MPEGEAGVGSVTALPGAEARWLRLRAAETRGVVIRETWSASSPRGVSDRSCPGRYSDVLVSFSNSPSANSRSVVWPAPSAGCRPRRRARCGRRPRSGGSAGRPPQPPQGPRAGDHSRWPSRRPTLAPALGVSPQAVKRCLRGRLGVGVGQKAVICVHGPGQSLVSRILAGREQLDLRTRGARRAASPCHGGSIGCLHPDKQGAHQRGQAGRDPRRSRRDRLPRRGRTRRLRAGRWRSPSRHR